MIADGCVNNLAKNQVSALSLVKIFQRSSRILKDLHEDLHEDLC